MAAVGSPTTRFTPFHVAIYLTAGAASNLGDPAQDHTPPEAAEVEGLKTQIAAMLAGTHLLGEQVRKLSAKLAPKQAQPHAQSQAQPPDAWLRYLQQQQAQQQPQKQQKPQQQRRSSKRRPAQLTQLSRRRIALLRPTSRKDAEKSQKFDSGSGRHSLLKLCGQAFQYYI